MLDPRTVGLELGRQIAASRAKVVPTAELKPQVQEPVVVNLPAMQVTVPEQNAPVVNVASPAVTVEPALVTIMPPEIAIPATVVNVEAPIINVNVDMGGVEKAIGDFLAVAKKQFDAAKNDAELLRMNLRAVIDSNQSVTNALLAPKTLVMKDGKPVGVKVG